MSKLKTKKELKKLYENYLKRMDDVSGWHKLAMRRCGGVNLTYEEFVFLIKKDSFFAKQYGVISN
jgi:hypothetical protein